MIWLQKNFQTSPALKDAEMAYNPDGLAYRDNILFGVYNSADHKENNAVLKYNLNAQGTAIIHEEIINRGNSLFRKPTTLSLINKRLLSSCCNQH